MIKIVVSPKRGTSRSIEFVREDLARFMYYPFEKLGRVMMAVGTNRKYLEGFVEWCEPFGKLKRVEISRGKETWVFYLKDFRGKKGVDTLFSFEETGGSQYKTRFKMVFSVSRFKYAKE